MYAMLRIQFYLLLRSIMKNSFPVDGELVLLALGHDQLIWQLVRRILVIQILLLTLLEAVSESRWSIRAHLDLVVWLAHSA